MSLPFKEKLLFTRNLAVMLKSGIPIGEALATLKEQTSNRQMKKVLVRLENGVTNGAPLSESLASFKDTFDTFYINLVEIGEKSGNLEKNLAYLAESLKKDYEFRQKVTGASIYPAVIFVTALVVGGGVAYFVLPKLIEIIAPLDIELPLSTKILLWLAATMRDFGNQILLGVVGFLTLLWLLYLVKPIRSVWQKAVMKVPLLGEFYVDVQMTYFCRNLGMMLKSGLPIFEALSSLARSTPNLVFQKYIADLAAAVQGGVSLSEAMVNQNMKEVPKMATKMVMVGDKSGKLEESLLYLADYFEEEVETTAKTFSNIIEPAMLLLVGGMVAFVAFSIISPIYRFTGSVGR